jgi:cilia- and flagella-associated protein 69
MAMVQSSQVVTLPKLPIPVIPHLIRDKDVVPTEGEEFKPLDLDKIIKLFTDPHSYHHLERHLHCLKKLAKHYNRGFLLKDIPKIIKILNVLSDKIEHDQTYASGMCSLITLCSYPYLKEKSSDELYAERILSECVANLGYLLRTPHADVRQTICSCIHNLITFKNVPEEYANTKRCSKQYLVKAIKNSDLPETLVKSLALMETNVELRIRMLQILQLLSKDTTNCDQMLNAECASRLVLRLNYPRTNEELLFRSVEILWNLLEFGGRKEDIAKQLNSLTAINQIREAFLHKIIYGYSNFDRQVRLVCENLMTSINYSNV